MVGPRHFFWPDADHVHMPDDTIESIESIESDKLAVAGEVIALTTLLLTEELLLSGALAFLYRGANLSLGSLLEDDLFAATM